MNAHHTLMSVMSNLVGMKDFLELFHVTVFVPETFQQQLYHLKSLDSQERELS